jgi:hypothetical protein
MGFRWDADAAVGSIIGGLGVALCLRAGGGPAPCVEPAQLAEIWIARGERERARQLLAECMEAMAKEDPGDFEGYEETLKRQKADFARLFPE